MLVVESSFQTYDEPGNKSFGLDEAENKSRDVQDARGTLYEVDEDCSTPCDNDKISEHEKIENSIKEIDGKSTNAIEDQEFDQNNDNSSKLQLKKEQGEKPIQDNISDNLTSNDTSPPAKFEVSEAEDPPRRTETDGKIHENSGTLEKDSVSDKEDLDGYGTAAVMQTNSDKQNEESAGENRIESDNAPSSCFLAFWYRLCLGINPFVKVRCSPHLKTPDIETDIDAKKETDKVDSVASYSEHISDDTRSKCSDWNLQNNAKSTSLASITSIESPQLLTSISASSNSKTEITEPTNEVKKTPSILSSMREKISKFFVDVEHDSNSDSVSDCSSVSYVDEYTQVSKTLTSSIKSSASYHTIKSNSKEEETARAREKDEEITEIEPYPEHNEQTVALPSCNIGGYTIYNAEGTDPGDVEVKEEAEVTEQKPAPGMWERPRRYTRKRFFTFFKLVRRYTRKRTE